MKLYLLLISLALASATIDYSLLTEFKSASNPQCTDSTPWSGINGYNFQSPIAIKNSQCLPYGYFDLSMSSPGALQFNADGTTGALKSTTTYNGATLKSDQFTWTSDAILIRRKAEHRLYIGNPDDPAASSNQAELEIQIRMSSSSTGSLAFLSFLVNTYNSTAITADKDMTQLAYQKSSDAVNIMKTASATGSIELDLNSVAKTIMAKINGGLYLNMFTYNGTTTYPSCGDATWFIYGNYLYIEKTYMDSITNMITSTSFSGVATLTTTTNYNYRPVSGTGGGAGAQEAARLCFSGYFDVYLNWNYGLWFGVVIIVFYFILTLSTGERPITDPDYKEDCMTIHPWISLWVVGNELHTRKTRASLILAILTLHALFNSVWYRISDNPEQPANIVVYAAYTMCISQTFIAMYGSILRQYYLAKRQFHITKDEKWNQRAQNRLFAFYSALFALIAICWPFCVWNMNELNPHRSQKSSNYWVASFFVGLGFEWLIIDFIWIYLAKKITFFRNFKKNTAFFYDDVCHATYMDYIKMD